MKKHVFGRQFNRDTNERKALFKGLINALVMQESITTTEAKARAIRGQVEKLVTKAKQGESAKRLLQPWLQAPALEKMLKDVAARFAERPGGYTRIIKLGERFGDNASMAVIEFVEKKEPESKIKKQESHKKQTVKDEVQSEVKVSGQAKAAKRSANKKEDVKEKNQRPPSKSEMQKRSAGKGSPKKESK